MKVLALIPARGGSKAVPGKNLAMAGGKHLIQYTIEAALGAGLVERVIVSTDDLEIAEVSRGAGAEVPFRRPVELAQDDSTTIDVVLHTLDWLATNERYVPTAFVLLQATSPLRTAEDIESAIRLMIDRSADSVVSVSPVSDHPLWTKTVTTNGTLTEFIPGALVPSRRQDLPAAYVLNGAIYISDTTEAIQTRRLVRPSSIAYIMPVERSLDVDTPWDLHLADLILKRL